MTITEKQFQAVVQIGGIVLAVCAILNLWVVLKFREVYRDRMKAEQEFQIAMVQVQRQAPQQAVLENVIRGFIPRAATDPKIAEMMQRYQVLNPPAAATNAPAAPAPAAGGVQ